LFPENSIKSNAFFGARLRIDSILYDIAMTSKLKMCNLLLYTLYK
jgi:hypothetical protein